MEDILHLFNSFHTSSERRSCYHLYYNSGAWSEYEMSCVETWTSRIFFMYNE
jgi:hypothetical protein